MELKKSKRKDYYKILGVDKNASEDEIKKAYRKRALMHHPGTHKESVIRACTVALIPSLVPVPSATITQSGMNMSGGISGQIAFLTPQI